MISNLIGIFSIHDFKFNWNFFNLFLFLQIVAFMKAQITRLEHGDIVRSHYWAPLFKRALNLADEFTMPQFDMALRLAIKLNVSLLLCLTCWLNEAIDGYLTKMFHFFVVFINIYLRLHYCPVIQTISYNRNLTSGMDWLSKYAVAPMKFRITMMHLVHSSL